MVMKFKKGDKVILLNGRDNDNNNVGWCGEMERHIGKTYTISKTYRAAGLPRYTLKECKYEYWYDEVWLRNERLEFDSEGNIW